jgi:hypothetical protein
MDRSANALKAQTYFFAPGFECEWRASDFTGGFGYGGSGHSLVLLHDLQVHFTVYCYGLERR